MENILIFFQTTGEEIIRDTIKSLLCKLAKYIWKTVKNYIDYHILQPYLFTTIIAIVGNPYLLLPESSSDNTIEKRILCYYVALTTKKKRHRLIRCPTNR